MTRDDIIRMAREASGGTDWWPVCGDTLERFAALVAAAEREECAKLCKQPVAEIQITDDCNELVFMDYHECAAAIRARNKA
jgi:hypothetical protein